MDGKIRKIKGLEERIKRIPRLMTRGLIIAGLTTSLLSPPLLFSQEKKGIEKTVKKEQTQVVQDTAPDVYEARYTPATIEDLIQNPQKYEAKDVEIKGIPIYSDFIASYNTIEFYLYLTDKKAITHRGGAAIVCYDYIPKVSANAYGGFFESLVRELDAYIKLREAYPDIIKPEIKVYGKFHQGKKGKWGGTTRGIEIEKAILQFHSGETKTIDFLAKQQDK